MLPPELNRLAASGYNEDGSEIKGGWRVFPTLTASGLWTTPSDLALFAIEIQKSFIGRSNKVLSQAMTRQMLTPQIKNDGLGVFVAGSGETLHFFHAGAHAGYEASLVAYATTGKGAIVIINTEGKTKSAALARIMKVIAKQYAWKGYGEAQPGH